MFSSVGAKLRARGHGPPKPFSLSIINTIVALLTPSSHATAPTGCAIEHLPCRTPAQLSVPTRGSGARLAPLRKLPAVGRGSVSSAGCESTGLPPSIHQHPFNPQSHSVSTFSRRPSKMASIHSRLILLLLSLYTRKYGFFIRLNIGSEIAHLGT